MFIPNLGFSCVIPMKDFCATDILSVYIHKLIKIVKRLDIDQKDIRCAESLHWNHPAKAKVGNDHRNKNPYAAQRLLLNLYSESIFQKTLEDRGLVIKVNRVWVNTIRYAATNVLISDNPDRLTRFFMSYSTVAKNSW